MTCAPTEFSKGEWVAWSDEAPLTETTRIYAGGEIVSEVPPGNYLVRLKSGSYADMPATWLKLATRPTAPEPAPSTAPAAKPANPFAAGLLGEVVSWDVAGISVRHAQVVQALKDAGLDEKIARQLAPRNAFCRACRKLADNRIIRHVSEDVHYLTFQFTAEVPDDGKFRYDFEALLTLDKQSGSVKCESDPALAALAQSAVDDSVDARRPRDITAIAQRVFDRKADLFPLRKQGGCYFVPQTHAELCGRVEQFLAAVGGSMQRLPVIGGTPHGDRSVKDAVAAGLGQAVEELRLAIQAFGEDTRSDTLNRGAERIRVNRFKVEVYAQYLADQRERLDRELDDAAALLREKVGAIADQPAGETVAAVA